MEAVTLTVAIPTYNGAATIGATLESICDQLVDRVDVLVSDNASTDGTEGVVATFISRFPNVKYRRNAINLGPDRNFDLAISHSSGTFAWLFSDDDLMEKDAIAVVLSRLERDPALAAVFVNYGVYSPDGRVQQASVLAPAKGATHQNHEEFFLSVRLGPLLCSANVFRRDLWVEEVDLQVAGSGWLHFDTLSHVVARGRSTEIYQPVIRAIERARWNTSGSLFRHSIRLVELVSAWPCKQETKRLLIGDVLRSIRANAIVAKRDGLVVSKDLLRSTGRNLGTYSKTKALLTVILLLIPRPIYRLAFAVYRLLTRRVP